MFAVFEISFDKQTHRALFNGARAEIAFSRFYQYLKYVSENTQVHRAAVITSILDLMCKEDVAAWFVRTLTDHF